MTIKIVTDSTTDISPDLAKNLGIEVVPGYVRFGNDTYRDGVDISKSGFYEKLADSPFLYGYSHYSITLLNVFKNIHPSDQLPKYRMLTIKVMLGSISDEKL